MVFLYSLFTILQIYIYISVGIYSFLRKIYSSRSLVSLSLTIMNFLLPIQGVIEIARMASIENIVQLWILVVSIIASIGIGYLCGLFYCFIFKIDLRMNHIYSFMLGLPSVGTLSLVLGRAFCFPGGPLESDDKCTNMLGYMKFIGLVFTVILYIIGFSFVVADGAYANRMEQILEYSWPTLCEKVFKRNYFVSYVFTEFLNDKKLAPEKFKKFDDRYKLKKIDNEIKFVLIDSLTDNMEKNLNDSNKNNYFHDANKNSKNDDIANINDLEEEKQKYIIEANNQDLNTINLKNVEKLFSNEAMIIGKDLGMKKIINKAYEEAQMNQNNGYANRENSMKINHKTNLSIINNDINNRLFKTKSYQDNYSFTSGFPSNKIEKFSLAKEYANIPDKMTKFLNEENPKMQVDKDGIFNEICQNANSIKNSYNKDIFQYFELLFQEVEKDLNKSAEVEYLNLKKSVCKELKNAPFKFPIARGVLLNRSNDKQINTIWEKEYLEIYKKYFPSFDLKKYDQSVNYKLIMNLMYSPPVVGCYLGLIIGMSNMRIVLFSKNHYISNLEDGLELVSKVTVPFLYITIGISFIAIPKLSLKMTVRKFHIVLGIFHRFIVMPSIGLLWIFLWSKYFGSYVKDSKVIRISMFIPFCVPSGANIVMLVNVIKYFVNEAAAVLVAQNISMIITLTIWYLIYFMVIGSDL